MAYTFPKPSLVIKNISNKSIRLFNLITIKPGVQFDIFDRIDQIDINDSLIIKALEPPKGFLYLEVEVKRTLQIVSCNLNTATSNTSLQLSYRNIGFGTDGSGAALNGGLKKTIRMPYSATIIGWTIIADQEGIAVVDVCVGPFSSGIPTEENSITGGYWAILSNQILSEGSDLSNWNTSLSAGDLVSFYLLSSADITSIDFYLKVQTNVAV